jgi:hypothetical protein
MYRIVQSQADVLISIDGTSIWSGQNVQISIISLPTVDPFLTVSIPIKHFGNSLEYSKGHVFYRSSLPMDHHCVPPRIHCTAAFLVGQQILA